jgi:hypothetical protein
MTAPIYDFPSSYQLEKIERIKLPRRTADSPFFEVMPLESAPTGAYLLEWEQGDVYYGFQQWRGLNNSPLTINRVGAKRYISEPGVYGEKRILREDELTRRRSMAAMSGAAGPIDLSDLVAEAQEQLLDRRINLIEKIVSDLLITGAFSVANVDGTAVYGGSYTQQAITPATAWSDLVNSTPLSDMLAYRFLEDGQDVTFGNGGDNFQLMNSVTLNYLLKNRNPNDLGGRRIGGGSTLNSVTDLNEILIDNDIPPIRVYNRGYFNASKTFTKFMPNGKVLVVGHRLSGVKVGAYRFTINQVSLSGATAPYTMVKVKDDVPNYVEVHDGHNGGPVLFYPGALILVNAA